MTASIWRAIFSISARSVPITLTPIGVRMPVDSMSMRALIGMVQALETPGNCSALAISAISLSNRTQVRPPFRGQERPLNGAETGGAEPHIAEQSRSWRAAGGGRRVASGRLCAVLEAPAFVAGLDDVAVVC